MRDLLDGFVFIDNGNPRAVIRGWLCWRHPDGRWVQGGKVDPTDFADRALPADQALLYGIRTTPLPAAPPSAGETNHGR